ncbi:hypothetical protein AB7C87_09650 [Natrarchaeobius sp. A-rgal3]|uniref:hypothetical protein n=1 Tax=Natrarchaeobius versutus TaxID=1679078 RepID=UPI00350F4A25
MKLQRTLAITLTVALFGGLMFMGFAGTAAAQDVNINDGDQINFGDQTTGDATATTNVNVNQQNNNAQIGVADADANANAIAAGSGHTKHGGAADALAAAGATADVTQSQSVSQSNQANVENVTTTAESGDNVQAAIEVNLDDFDP